MEAIIIFVVISFLSYLLNGKGKKQEQKPMPPFNNSPAKTRDQQTLNREPKSLEDFAKEVFQQLNEKSEPNPKPVIKHEQPQVTAVKEEAKRVTKPRQELNTNRSTTKSMQHKVRQNDPIKTNEIGSVIPTNRKALVQAIIASEIIGPPKAKQR